MEHMNEVMELLDNIINCCESISKLGRIVRDALPGIAEAITGISSKPKAIENKPAAKKTKKDEPAVKAYSFEDVRKAFSQKSHEGYTAEVKALISKYGASRLSDIKEEDYASLMADLEGIG